MTPNKFEKQLSKTFSLWKIFSFAYILLLWKETASEKFHLKNLAYKVFFLKLSFFLLYLGLYIPLCLACEVCVSLGSWQFLNDLYASFRLKVTLRISSTVCSQNLLFSYCNWKSIAAYINSKIMLHCYQRFFILVTGSTFSSSITSIHIKNINFTFFKKWFNSIK